MSTSSQQQQAQSFFDRIALDWRKSAEGNADSVNVIVQRNNYVLRVADGRENVRTALDVGCGTGELVHELCKRGVSAIGVDFAPEMIKLAAYKASADGLKGCEFVCGSIFDYKPGTKFDLLSANGFIEYLSPEQWRQFLRMARGWLNPGGSLVFGSRNRLFNAFSMNNYTSLEMSRNTLVSLISEALVIGRSEDLVTCIQQLSRYRQELPTVGEHPETGIGVATRHQYTPAELIGMLERIDFQVAGLAPIHYHGVPPRFAKAHPQIHTAISEGMNATPEHYLIPFASTFMVHAVKDS